MYSKCVGRWGKSDAFAQLEEFRQKYLMQGNRDVETSFIAKLAALPLSLPFLTSALYKCQLTCREEFFVKNVFKYIGVGEVDGLRPGRVKHQAALECEAVLVGFRDRYRSQLAAMSSDARTAILTKLDTQACRLLLGKKCKHTSYEALQGSLGEAFGAGAALPAASQGALGSTIVSFDGGAAGCMDRLRDLGIVPGAWVETTKENGAIALGAVACVKSVTAEHLTLTVGALEAPRILDGMGCGCDGTGGGGEEGAKRWDRLQ